MSTSSISASTSFFSLMESVDLVMNASGQYESHPPTRQSFPDALSCTLTIMGLAPLKPKQV